MFFHQPFFVKSLGIRRHGHNSTYMTPWKTRINHTKKKKKKKKETQQTRIAAFLCLVPRWKPGANNQGPPQSCFGATIRGNEIGPVLHLECTASLPENNSVCACVSVCVKVQTVHLLCVSAGLVRWVQWATRGGASRGEEPSRHAKKARFLALAEEGELGWFGCVCVYVFTSLVAMGVEEEEEDRCVICLLCDSVWSL